jgi:hypothetical protein
MSALLFLTNVFVPVLRLLLDELVHQLATFFVVQDYDLDAPALQILLTTYEGLVLADDNPLNLVHDAGPSAHVARTKGGVHGSTSISCSGKAPSDLKSRYLCL